MEDGTSDGPRCEDKEVEDLFRAKHCQSKRRKKLRRQEEEERSKALPLQAEADLQPPEDLPTGDQDGPDMSIHRMKLTAEQMSGWML